MWNRIWKAISIKLVLVSLTSLIGAIGLTGCASNDTKDESLTAEERKEAAAKRRAAMTRNSAHSSGHGGCG